MLFLHRLMTIYIPTTRCFGCIAGGWNLQVQNIFLYYRWLHLQHLLWILNLEFGTDSGEDQYFFTIQLHPHSVTLGLSSDLLMIYSSCSCTWSLPYSYWKSSVTCVFSRKSSLGNLKVSYWLLFLHMILRFLCFFSRLLLVVVLGVYSKFSLNLLFSRHHCNVLLFFRMFLYCTIITKTFCRWIWAIPVLRLVDI